MEGGGWGKPPGLSVEGSVGLACGRLQSSCQVGSERGISEFTVEFKLDSYYYSLRDAGKVDIHVKLPLAPGLGSLTCDALWRMGHVEPAHIKVYVCRCLKERMFECESRKVIQ